MPRKKAKPMPPVLWVARTEGYLEFLTWDLDPLMPIGETATRYIRVDVAAKIARTVADEQRGVPGRPGESVARHIARLIEAEGK
jgi:hypothetical protein